MKQGIVKSLTKQLREACERAERTGENQWIEVPQSCHGELSRAMDDVFVGEMPWLRKTPLFQTGVRIEVLESYRVGKGLPPY